MQSNAKIWEKEDRVIKNITEDELMILDREGIEWLPTEGKNNDVSISCDKYYFEMVLHTIRRI